MGVHLPVDAELNDLVKPDEEDTATQADEHAVPRLVYSACEQPRKSTQGGHDDRCVSVWPRPRWSDLVRGVGSFIAGLANRVRDG